MELSCSLPPGRAIVEQAQLAESLGYRRLWVAEFAAAGLTELLYAPLGPDIKRELTAMRSVFK